MTLHRFAIAAFCVAAASPAVAEPNVVALSEHDERAYRAAFNAIEEHDWRGVTRALDGVEDESLVGVVRGRMLLSRAYRPSRAELNSWLTRYEDYGLAGAVYERANQIRGRGRRRGPAPPEPERAGVRVLPGAAPFPVGDSAAARVAIARIGERVGEGDITGARALAFETATGPRSGQAEWWLGVLAYRDHDYAEAVRHFELSAAWPHHGGWAGAAAHYWAARARLATGEHEGVVLHLEQAAQRPWTFYGQLAEAQLGRDSALNFTPPELNEAEAQTFLTRHEGARRAAALAQLGRLSEVEGELRRLHGDLDPSEDRTYLALAVALRAPSAQLRAAEFGGPELASGFCPATTFIPEDGFTLDRALVYAIVRQESYYNPTAVSVSNARGLMQLLPSTANDMDRSKGFRRNPAQLFEPGLNMRLGQSYLRWLMDEFHNDGDLGRVFAAYNGGPGWLRRWLETQADSSDPLMVLETMSRLESRDYAERALSHMALCRKSFGQPTPEMDRLAGGQAAAYQPLDAQLVASNSDGAAQ
jgi:soluble lytic murein transglycosylase-like protein